MSETNPRLPMSIKSIMDRLRTRHRLKNLAHQLSSPALCGNLLSSGILDPLVAKGSFNRQVSAQG